MSFILYRQAWALVSVIGDGESSCNESVRDYENHSTGGKALAEREFFTVDGQKFTVRAFSEWIAGKKNLNQVVKQFSTIVYSWNYLAPHAPYFCASAFCSWHSVTGFGARGCGSSKVLKYQIKLYIFLPKVFQSGASRLKQ